MKERDILLVKATLSFLAGLLCLGAGYFTFDNKLLGLGLGTILASGIIYRTYKSTIQTYQDKDTEIIFNGFSLKSSIIYIAFWGTMTYLFYQDNRGFHYLFYGLFFLTLAIDEGLRLLIFDYNKKTVTGLFDSKKQDMSQLTIDYVIEDSSHKIKITDKSGFFLLDKKSFTDNNWNRLINNFDKIKMRT